MAMGLVAFILYATWATFQNSHYYAAPYLSPFYSPCVSANCTYQTAPLVGSWWKVSPALAVVWIPLGFRTSCYYFRRVYYRSFWLSPPACAVADARPRYSGESRLPLILNNVHRYFFYLAFALAIVDSWDAVAAFDFSGHFGIGLGSLIMLTDAVLLWSYTLGCHSCRHLVGGRLKLLSAHRIRYRLWKGSSVLNRHHGLFGWTSLGWVGFTDLYVRLVSTGVITDPRWVLH